MILTNDQLLIIYDIVYSSVHSDSFKISEVKDLLFDNEYWFIEKPKQGWGCNLFDYLDSIKYNKSLLNINPSLLIWK